MSDDLPRLYQERAELAEIESDCDDAMKYVWQGGILYRLFSWIKRSAASGRVDVQAEIDELKGQTDE